MCAFSLIYLIFFFPLRLLYYIILSSITLSFTFSFPISLTLLYESTQSYIYIRRISETHKEYRDSIVKGYRLNTTFLSISNIFLFSK